MLVFIVSEIILRASVQSSVRATSDGNIRYFWIFVCNRYFDEWYSLLCNHYSCAFNEILLIVFLRDVNTAKISLALLEYHLLAVLRGTVGGIREGKEYFRHFCNLFPTYIDQSSSPNLIILVYVDATVIIQLNSSADAMAGVNDAHQYRNNRDFQRLAKADRAVMCCAPLSP